MSTFPNITLAAARINAGLTQAEASERIQVNPGAINAWEQGINTPSAANLIKMAEVYEWPMQHLILPKKKAR